MKTLKLPISIKVGLVVVLTEDAERVKSIIPGSEALFGEGMGRMFGFRCESLRRQALEQDGLRIAVVDTFRDKTPDRAENTAWSFRAIHIADEVFGYSIKTGEVWLLKTRSPHLKYGLLEAPAGGWLS